LWFYHNNGDTREKNQLSLLDMNEIFLKFKVKIIKEEKIMLETLD